MHRLPPSLRRCQCLHKVLVLKLECFQFSRNTIKCTNNKHRHNNMYMPHRVRTDQIRFVNGNCDDAQFSVTQSNASLQNMSQYNQPIYVSSSSNQIQPPSMHPQSHNSNSPIYVSTNQQAPGLPNSVSNNSVYNSQQQQPQPSSTIYAPSNGLPSNGGNYPIAAQISAIPQAPPFPTPMSNGGPPMPPAMPTPAGL